ncbi:response regulator [Thiocapsa roseopersicina]|uniref:Two-component system, OmpR family, response regulator QseB n=1 Tax=Thiocapsa roseopersicina TaxID=1058 RepID=A0A1H2R399_THIRO|nr:response regulator [Thiocapsa roseopersicina]SDW13678.1 two-component system, OmpR family, response regulator QseB [Thiocapsa roseopersicina]
MRVLIVEDDPLLGAGLRTGLCQDGYRADWVQSADPAEHALRVEHFDVLVLDLGLPGRDGLSLLRALRSKGIDLPILILTARDAVADKVAGLDAGADDYLVKPVDLDELSARIRALTRRRDGHATPRLLAGELALDTVRHEVSLGDRPLSLSPREFVLLETLIANADRVVPRARLAATAYGWRDEIESNALEVHIHNLRNKLGKHRILTVRGVGYRLVSVPPQ